MASRTPIDLTFGDQKFTIRPLTFKQVQSLSEKLAKPIGDDNLAQMALARDAISIALGRDNPDVKLDDLECDVGELPNQLLAIMELGGFRPREVSAGEAPAAAGRSDGATSEAA